MNGFRLSPLPFPLHCSFFFAGGNSKLIRKGGNGGGGGGGSQSLFLLATPVFPDMYLYTRVRRGQKSKFDVVGTRSDGGGIQLGLFCGLKELPMVSGFLYPFVFYEPEFEI